MSCNCIAGSDYFFSSLRDCGKEGYLRNMNNVLLVLGLIHFVAGARILGIIPTPSISHQLPFRLLMQAMHARGHHVTVITTDPIKDPPENYSQIDMSFSYDYMQSTYDCNSLVNMDPISLFEMILPLGTGICQLHLESPPLKEFINSGQKFDLVIMEKISYQCYYGVWHKVGAPVLVGFLSFGIGGQNHGTFGNIDNPSYMPNSMIDYSDHMTFWERLYNTYLKVRTDYIFFNGIIPEQEALLRHYFGPEPPPVYETEYNFSLLLSSNHWSAHYPTPLLPNMVELTGLHIQRERKPLPKDVQEFLDGAEHGVIYFSLGSNVKSSAMPQEKVQAFVDAFSELPQRILWKWEVEDLPGKPKNVMVSKWLSQQDVLAHPNVKLFITQGGLQSFNEASYYGVPLVGIPFLGDQRYNVKKMETAGIGIKLDYNYVTKETVLKSVNTVLLDKGYKERMEYFSAVYREVADGSVEKAVWWLEYVLRHNGARFLRSASLDLTWTQLYLLDVLFVVEIIVLAVTLITFIAVRRFYCRRRGSVGSKKTN